MAGDVVVAFDVVDLGVADESVYKVVVARQPVTVQELLSIEGLDELGVRAALEVLIDKGLVSRVPGEAGQYVAVPPDIGLEALLLDKEEQIKRARIEASRLAGLHGRLVSEDYPHVVEIVSGRDAALQRFVQVQRVARREIRIIDKPPYVATDPECNADVEREVLARGVVVRAIYDADGLETFHQLGGDVQAIAEAGEQVRVLPQTPTKLVVIDDRIALIPLRTEPTGIDKIVVVYPSALLTALTELFEQLWERSLPLCLSDGDRMSLPLGATVEELQLLNLMTVGLTDETIARQLDISQRTMQRRLRALLDRLGVQTRFQAALRAAALGWVPMQPSELREPALLAAADHEPSRSLHQIPARAS